MDENFRAQGSPSSLHYKQLLQSQSLSLPLTATGGSTQPAETPFISKGTFFTCGYSGKRISRFCVV